MKYTFDAILFPCGLYAGIVYQDKEEFYVTQDLYPVAQALDIAKTIATYWNRREERIAKINSINLE